MSKTKKKNYKKRPLSPNAHPTIGFLTSSGDQLFHQMWCGIDDVAREHNVNAISFVGQAVKEHENFEDQAAYGNARFYAQANILYDLIDVEQLDGLVIWGLLCNMLDPDKTKEFYERYRPLTIVSVAQPMDNITNVLVDNYGGMREAITHLVEAHGCCRIAYIKGLPNFQEHDDRYQAYVDVLAEYGLPFDPGRVVVPRSETGLEGSNWGQVALCRLLDEQKADFDALVTNDDGFAHQLLPELQARGIRVPEDLALVSFDDIEGSNSLPTPLTTVPYPMYELGRQAAETLLAQLESQAGVEQVKVPARLKVRQSCGCLDSKVTQVPAGPVGRTGVAEPMAVSLVAQRERIVAEIMQAAELSAAGLPPNWAEKLLDGFVAALTAAKAGEASPRFLSTLAEILGQALAANGDIKQWSQVLATLRRQLLPYIGITEARDRAEDLWLQAQVLIERLGQRAQAYHELQVAQRNRILNEINMSLLTHFDVNDLADILAQELPRLGITRGYLAVYEQPGPYRYPQPAPEWARLVLAFDEKNPPEAQRLALEPGGRRFPTRQLVPEGILPQPGPYNLIVQALYFQKQQIGFLLLDSDQCDGHVYEILRAQISSVLQSVSLMQQVQEHATQLDIAVSETRATVKELEAFTHSVSHDLRAPLRRINGFSQVLLEDYENALDTAGQDYLRRISSTSQHMGQLIDDLLSLSRLTQQEMRQEIVDLSKLAREIVAELRQTKPERDIEILIAEKIIVTGDPDLLRIALHNLLSNAWKFTANRAPAKVQFYEHIRDNEHQYIIKDNGAGFDMQYADQLFRAFQRLHHQNEFKGTGIGLTTVQRIVQRHGGRIWAEAEPDKGATFYFTLN